MADGDVTLLIRSPSLQQEEREVRAPRDSTVRELKAQLRQELPGEPMEQDQRLIYSGKLLPDHLKLNEVLSKETRHVLHLVCSTKSPPKTQAEGNGQPSGSTAASILPPANSLTDGVRQRSVTQNIPAAHGRPLGQYQQGAAPAFSAYAAYTPQQILWWQQMYARQYYMQQYLAAAATSSPSPRSPEIPPVPAAAPDQLPNPFPADNQPANPNVQPPANPVANANLRMNAQGGVVEEEDEINRDWLDWVYTAARFSIFLSILYFYSSLSRFMMVLGAMVLVYLHHAGWFPFRQRPAQVPNPHPQAVQNHQDQNNNLQVRFRSSTRVSWQNKQ
ncbi:hypothetical protein FKM82_003574 [Ascaphus truei]